MIYYICTCFTALERCIGRISQIQATFGVEPRTLEIEGLEFMVSGIMLIRDDACVFGI